MRAYRLPKLPIFRIQGHPSQTKGYAMRIAFNAKRGIDAKRFVSGSRNPIRF